MSSSTIPNHARRRLVQGGAALGGFGLLGLGGCATASAIGAPSNGAASAGVPIFEIPPPLAPVRAEQDRLFDITVCLRPFRAAGPRMDVEQIGDTLVVHNYGHGGSGWSLSWGAGALAVQKAMAGSPRNIAVLGCGALGLTAATLAQKAGANVTIYARDMLPQTRSARATGSWTPDSRIALAGPAGPGFATIWEQMARTSFKTYRSYLGLPGTPVEWTDRYYLSDLPPGESPRSPDPLGFAEYTDRIRDLTPRPELLPRAISPFPTAYVQRTSSMQFNIADYGHTLLNDFLVAGGKIERREFHSPQELTLLKEKVVINCPGFGGKALWKDDSIVPVRGQIAWLIPQPEVNYGFMYNNVSVLSRRDGIVVQALDGGDMKGYGEVDETPDRQDAEKAVATIAELYSRFPGPART